MAPIRCWQVDAFTKRPFGGNPAAVCWLEAEADPRWMQSVASEMNLSETAFARKSTETDGYELRWFTPTTEVDLCGHATLATAHALWTAGVVPDDTLRFHSRSGELTCTRSGDFIELDFPATPAVTALPPPELLEGLGVQPVSVGKSRFDYLVVLESAGAVRALRPDCRRLSDVSARGVIVTAAADELPFDFVSRFFAPNVGVDEDPVCGSAHCCLAPFWGDRLGKTEMWAYQASARGGTLRLRLAGDRVILGGQAVTVWHGELV